MLSDGDQAPDFTADDQHGNTVTLSEQDGTIVLYFYPKDDTPGCTKEACSFRDSYAVLQDEGITVLGVSADGVDSHEAFSSKYDLPFSLLADPDKEIIDKYDVRGSFGNAKRVTFVIEDGEIINVIEDVDTENHAEQVLSQSESADT